VQLSLEKEKKEAAKMKEEAKTAMTQGKVLCPVVVATMEKSVITANGERVYEGGSIEGFQYAGNFAENFFWIRDGKIYSSGKDGIILSATDLPADKLKELNNRWQFESLKRAGKIQTRIGH
jgi:hypothetical protein